MDGEPGDFTMSEGHGHPLVNILLLLQNVSASHYSLSLLQNVSASHYSLSLLQNVSASHYSFNEGESIKSPLGSLQWD